MDANKLKVLQDVGYTIEPSCGLCRYGVFTPASQFGTCTLHLYEHEKHTGDKRQLSVYRSGRCATFQADDLRPLLGEAWANLVRPLHGGYVLAKMYVSGPTELVLIRPSDLEAKDAAVIHANKPLTWQEENGVHGRMWFAQGDDVVYWVAELGRPPTTPPWLEPVLKDAP